MRGFLQDALIPEDQAQFVRRRRAEIVGMPGEPDPLGSIVRSGDTFYLIRLELRFPIPLDESLQGGIFADVGNVWAVADSFDLAAPRWTAGLGIRVSTPVGPIAVDYGFVLDRREDLGEPFGSLHFSFGLF